MLTELKNRGVVDVCIVCCDGLSGFPDAIEAVWPQATVQTVGADRGTIPAVDRRDEHGFQGGAFRRAFGGVAPIRTRSVPPAASALSVERVRIEAAVSNLTNAESTRSANGQPYRRR